MKKTVSKNRSLGVLWKEYQLTFLTVLTLLNFIIVLITQSYIMYYGRVISHNMEGMTTMAQSGKTDDQIFSRMKMVVTPTEIPFYAKDKNLKIGTEAEINAFIGYFANLAPYQGKNPLVLNDEELKRYVAIGTQPMITCEFCCGVTTLVTKEGKPTCSCAHSQAMRGALAYMIRNFPKMSDTEMSYEIARQKGLYFPKQMMTRMVQLLTKDDEKAFTPDIKALLSKLSSGELKKLSAEVKKADFSKGPGADMVGGC